MTLTSHADNSLLAGQIGDVLRCVDGARREVRCQEGSSRMTVFATLFLARWYIFRVFPVREEGAGPETTLTTKVSLNDAKMCATPNTCSPSRGLGRCGFFSSTTGAAPSSLASTCDQKVREKYAKAGFAASEFPASRARCRRATI